MTDVQYSTSSTPFMIALACVRNVVTDRHETNLKRHEALQGSIKPQPLHAKNIPIGAAHVNLPSIIYSKFSWKTPMGMILVGMETCVLINNDDLKSGEPRIEGVVECI